MVSGVAVAEGAAELQVLLAQSGESGLLGILLVVLGLVGGLRQLTLQLGGDGRQLLVQVSDASFFERGGDDCGGLLGGSTLCSCCLTLLGLQSRRGVDLVEDGPPSFSSASPMSLRDHVAEESASQRWLWGHDRLDARRTR